MAGPTKQNGFTCACCAKHEAVMNMLWLHLLTGPIKGPETHLNDNAISSKQGCSQGVEDVVEGVVEGHNRANLHIALATLEVLQEHQKCMQSVYRTSW